MDPNTDPLGLSQFRNSMLAKYPNMTATQRKSLDDFIGQKAQTALVASGDIDYSSFAEKNPLEAYNLRSAGFSPTASAKPTADQQKKLDKESQALQNLDILEGYLTGAEVRGPVAGRLGFLGDISGGVINPKAYQFNQLRNALISPLARVISGEVGTLNEGDVKRAESLLPRLEEDPEVAKTKIATLRALLNARQGQKEEATPDKSQSRKGFVQSVIEAITSPFIETGKTIGGAAYEVGQELAGNPAYLRAQQGTQSDNPFLSDTELQKYDTDPAGQVLNQAGRSAAMAAYGVPITKSTSLFGSAVPALGRVTGGARAGAVSGAGKPEGADLGARVGNVALGAGVGAIIGVVANKLAGKKAVSQQTEQTQKAFIDSTDEVQKLSADVQGKSSLARIGRDMAAKQYNVPRNAAMRLHLRDTVQQLDDYGLTNIDKVREVVPKVTGDTGVITKITRDATQTARPVSLDGLLDMADEISLDPSLPTGTDAKFVQFMKKGVMNLPNTKSTGASSAALSQVGDPAKTFDFVQSLEAKASQLVSPRAYGVISDQNVALSKAYRLMADELKTRLFFDSGADEVAVNLVSNPKYFSQLSAISPKLAERATQATTLGEIRSLAAPFVRAGQAIQITDAGEFLVFNNLVDAVNRGSNVLSRLSNIPSALLQTNQARAGIGGLLMRLGGGSQTAAQPLVPALNTTGGNALMRLLTTGIAGAQ